MPTYMWTINILLWLCVWREPGRKEEKNKKTRRGFENCVVFSYFRLSNLFAGRQHFLPKDINETRRHRFPFFLGQSSTTGRLSCFFFSFDYSVATPERIPLVLSTGTLLSRGVIHAAGNTNAFWRMYVQHIFSDEE